MTVWNNEPGVFERQIFWDKGVPWYYNGDGTATPRGIGSSVVNELHQDGSPDCFVLAIHFLSSGHKEETQSPPGRTEKRTLNYATLSQDVRDKDWNYVTKIEPIEEGLAQRLFGFFRNEINAVPIGV